MPNRSFWSGNVAFGLVSIPVSLFVANRSNRVALRMLDEDGTPLARRYFCSKDGKALKREDLIRGYEIEKGKFIEIKDDELDALVPDKSREIDLKRFVPLNEIDPVLFERAYYLVPDEGANKAYRLLAASMEDMGKAGIATFVMRGKEYLIAIISDGGILRAETMRFLDELRTPDYIGLPEASKAPSKLKSAFSKEIKKLSTSKLKSSELKDRASKELMDIVKGKIKAGEGVKQAPEEAEESESADVIDLMQILKQSLSKDDSGGAKTKSKANAKGKANSKGKTKTRNNHDDSKSTKRKPAAKGKSTNKRSAKNKVDPDASKAELYELAKKLDIPGRSKMSRKELLKAVK